MTNWRDKINQTITLKATKEQCKYFKNEWCKYPRLIFQMLCTDTEKERCVLKRIKKEK